MRELFISEHHYIGNVLNKWTSTCVETHTQVMREYYAPPRTTSNVRFNNDYVLEFAAPEDLKRPANSYCAAVLPNTLGVDVFVTVNHETAQPLMTELLGGEAFPIKYFKEHVEKVEDRLAQLSQAIDFRRTSYSRLFVIENDICFLAFPDDEKPVDRGEKILLCNDEESSIACSIEQGKLVYVDGWIRTRVAESNNKIEAECAADEKDCGKESLDSYGRENRQGRRDQG